MARLNNLAPSVSATNQEYAILNHFCPYLSCAGTHYKVPVVNCDVFEMTHKAAYLWGPISSFSGPLTAWLLQKGWHVHIATKSTLNVFTLAPLDLRSSAQSLIERALGGHDQMRTFQDRLRFLEIGEVAKGTTYDAVIFCGLPPNFDEPRTPRAPWAAGELAAISKMLKGVPTFIISSLWAGVQPDGVIPEELEFERRKPKSHWEGICQQYESKLLKALSALEAPWHLIRLPIISGANEDGRSLNFSGLFSLLRELSKAATQQEKNANNQDDGVLRFKYNPDSTMWFLPVDNAVSLFWRLLEDNVRPRICNLVSTQTTLNREWLGYLARALGFKNVAVGETNNHLLPGILRRLLIDNVQVKTRNLFEVAGRYQQVPMRLDEAYFTRLIEFGKSENWGKQVVVKSAIQSTEEILNLARTYFEEFLPQTLSKKDLEEATASGTSIMFILDEQKPLAWILVNNNGEARVERQEAKLHKSAVSFKFSWGVMGRLLKGEQSLHRAIFLREVKAEGKFLEVLRVSNVLARFFKEHSFTGVELLSDRPTAEPLKSHLQV